MKTEKQLLKFLITTIAVLIFIASAILNFIEYTRSYDYVNIMAGVLDIIISIIIPTAIIVYKKNKKNEKQ